MSQLAAALSSGALPQAASGNLLLHVPRAMMGGCLRDCLTLAVGYVSQREQRDQKADLSSMFSFLGREVQNFQHGWFSHDLQNEEIFLQPCATKLSHLMVQIQEDQMESELLTLP